MPHTPNFSSSFNPADGRLAIKGVQKASVVKDGLRSDGLTFFKAGGCKRPGLRGAAPAKSKDRIASPRS